MTVDDLRAALARSLRFYGINNPELLDELAAIADQHAAEEAAIAPGIGLL